MKAVLLYLAATMFVSAPFALRAISPAPVITSFSPLEGPVGAWIGIVGTDLMPVTAVEFNGISAQFTSMAGQPVVAKVPEGAITGPITIRTPSGSFTTVDSFKVVGVPQPSLFSFSPASGAPGAQIRLSGSNLANATAVKFNGIDAYFSNILVPDLLTVVPAGASTGRITVQTPGGTTTSEESFIVLPPPVIGPPIVYSFSPSEGIPDTVVTLKGTNFQGLVSISFGGVETKAGWMVDWASARVPTNGVTGPITVTTTNGSFTTKEVFTVLPPPPPPPPTVSYFTPWIGEVGTSVRIQGVNLERVTEVEVNGMSVEFTIEYEPFWGSAIAIKIVIPPDATTGAINVISPEGAATWFRDFTVVPKPIVTGFDPDYGRPGTVVALLGTNLEQIVSLRIGSNSVEYDKTRRAFTVPLEAISGPVTVASAYSESLSTSAFTVTHEDDLRVIETVSVTNLIVPTVMLYRVTVMNKGPETLSEVLLTDRFARESAYVSDGWSLFPESTPTDTHANSGLEVKAASASQGQCFITNGVVQCYLGTIAAFQTATAEVALNARISGVVYHMARAVSAAADPNPSDNRCLSATLILDRSELQIRKLEGNQLEVRWPSGNAALLPEFADRVTGIAWKPAIAPVLEADGWRVLVQQATNESMFYRFEPIRSP